MDWLKNNILGKANQLVTSSCVKSLYSRFQEIDRLHIGAGIFKSFRFLHNHNHLSTVILSERNILKYTCTSLCPFYKKIKWMNFKFKMSVS